MYIQNILKFIGIGLILTFTSLSAATKVPISGDFYISSEKVEPTQAVELTLDFSLLMNYSVVEVSLYTPKGVVLLKGKMKQTVSNIDINQIHSLKYTIEYEDKIEQTVTATIKVLNLENMVLRKDFLVKLNSNVNTPKPVYLKP